MGAYVGTCIRRYMHTYTFICTFINTHHTYTVHTHVHIHTYTHTQMLIRMKDLCIYIDKKI